MENIKVKTKKEFEMLVKEYRAKGYNLITLGKMFAELEQGNSIVIIEK